ncbi:MAG: zinc ribbon domain-containing protein [Desulfohalobiaceae bacterium]|nr:zinc ribbon domain-containing protein [Desulfohalobiaceae bacterium]
MKALVSIIMGFFSGILIYFMAALVFASTESSPSPVFVGFFLIGGWILSAYIIKRNAHSLSRVFSRGFLLGAAEWLFLIPASMIFSGKAVSDAVATSSGSGAAKAGAVVGGGIVTTLTGGVAIAMALACLLGFAVAHFLGREMQPEPGRANKQCPECAEMVQEQAKKCRFCGYTFE